MSTERTKNVKDMVRVCTSVFHNVRWINNKIIRPPGVLKVIWRNCITLIYLCNVCFVRHGTDLCSNSAARLEEEPACCFAAIAGYNTTSCLLDIINREDYKIKWFTQPNKLKYHAILIIYTLIKFNNIITHPDFHVETVNYMAKCSG